MFCKAVQIQFYWEQIIICIPDFDSQDLLTLKNYTKLLQRD